jgi:PAS domain S-box-containing protein
LSDQERVLVRIMGGATHCRWVNRAWRGFTGRSTKELLGEGWLRHVHSDDREHYAEACREAFESVRIYRMEYRLQRRDGEYGWVLEIGSPRLDAQGKIGGFIGVATEISQHEQTRARPERQAALDQVLPQARHTGTTGHNGKGNGSQPHE